MGEVQQLPELTPRFVEVADHPVLAAAYLAVLLTHAGDAGLDEFQELQAALSELPVQGGQPGRRVIKTIPERDSLHHRRCEYAIRDLMLRDGCTDARWSRRVGRSSLLRRGLFVCGSPRCAGS